MESFLSAVIQGWESPASSAYFKSQSYLQSFKNCHKLNLNVKKYIYLDRERDKHVTTREC